MSEERSAVETGGIEALRSRLQSEHERLEREIAVRRKGVAAVRALLGKGVLENPRKLAGVLRRQKAKLADEERSQAGLASAWAEVERWVEEAPQRLRRELGRALQQACAARNIPLRVISREDPVELRLPPLALRLDFRRGKGVFSFARDPLLEVPLDAGAILDGYDRVRAELQWEPFEPRAFFDACRKAYRQALVECGGREGERVELLAFLPLIAVQMQSARFRENPHRETFRSYGRAHLAYDTLRLRRAEGLAQNGWRLNLGVATGNTAQQKKRVIYFEDEHGQGEYKLTIFFTPEKEPVMEGGA